jgi:polar amino acid transport system substrate-binding protein
MMRRKGLKEVVTIFGLIICLFFILGGGSFVAAQEESALHRIKRTGVIRIGWAAHVPWMRLDEKTNKVVGISSDVYEELVRALGNVRMEWVADSWVTIIAGLQSNKFDIVFPLAFSIERALACEYTNDMMREANTFLIKKKDTTKFKTHDDINQPGVKIAVTLGSSSDIYLTKSNIKKPEIVRLKSSPECLMAMTLGKVDAWATNGSALLDASKAHPDTTVVKGSYATGKINMGIKQGDQIFLNWLNLFIGDMMETGALDRIYQKYGTKREIFFD